MTDAERIAQNRHFSQPETVSRVLHDSLDGYIDQLEPSTLEPLAAVTDAFRAEAGQMLWRLRRRRGGWSYVIVLPEFDPVGRRHVAERILAYAAIAFDEAARDGRTVCASDPPDVFPSTLYCRRTSGRISPDLARLMQLGRRIVTYDRRRPRSKRVVIPGEGPPPLARDLLPVLAEVERTMDPQAARRALGMVDAWVWTPPADDRSKLEYIGWLATVLTRRTIRTPVHEHGPGEAPFRAAASVGDPPRGQAPGDESGRRSAPPRAVPVVPSPSARPLAIPSA